MKAAILVTTVALAIFAIAQEKAPENADRDFEKVPEAPSPEQIAAREAGILTASTNALSVAHQIAASQGYRRRDAVWTGQLPAEGFTIIPLQLYAGNDYYVVLGSDTADGTVSAAAFDPERMLIKTAPDSAPGKMVFHITPKISGPHYFRIHHGKAEHKPTHCAMTYIYR